MKFLSSIDVNREYTLPLVDGNAGQALLTDGSGGAYWGTISTAVALNDLTDVIITTPTTGQLLRYNGTSWVNWNPNFLTAESDTLNTVVQRGASTLSSITVGGLNVNGTATITGTLTVPKLEKSGSQIISSIEQAEFEGQVLKIASFQWFTTEIAKIESNGKLTAGSFVKYGGTSSQFLKADGSVDSNTYLTSYSETDTLATVTARGNTTTTSISTTSSVSAASVVTELITASNTLSINSTAQPDQGTTEIITSFKHQTTQVASVNTDGDFTGNKFIKTGGTASQFLKADGSVDTNTYLTAHPAIANGGSVNNSLGTVVQDITVDANGHVTAIGSVDLDARYDVRYYTQESIDGFFGGDFPIAGYNLVNWDTAYSWGNHASAGYATTSYVTTAIANLVDSAPATLDTLNELAAALGDDPNFATTVTNSIAGKVSKSGDTMTGELVFSMSAPQIRFADIDHYDHWIHVNSNRFYILSDRNGDGTWETPYPLELNSENNTGYVFSEVIATRPWVTSQGYLTTYENNYISDVRLNESTLEFAGEGSAFNGTVDLSTLPFAPQGSYLTAEADTLSTVVSRGSTTSSTISVVETTAGGFLFRTNSGWGAWARNGFSFANGSGTPMKSLGAYGDTGTSLGYMYLGTDYQTNTFRIYDNYVYVPGLDLAMSNSNSDHGVGTYFRGDGTHFVLGLRNGNTLYLNYGNPGGTIYSFGTNYHSGTTVINGTALYTTGGAATLSVVGNVISFGASNEDLSYFRRLGAGQFQWQTYNSGNTGEIHLQPYGGNVGIGTTAPATKLDVSGVITADGGNSTKWNAAYDWGNHADFGYITGYTETDTLATVTSRGASTSTTLNLNGRVNIGNGLARPNALNSDSVAHARIGGADVHLYVASLEAAGGYRVAVQAARTSDFASFGLDLQSNGGTLFYGGNEIATRTWVTSQGYLTTYENNYISDIRLSEYSLEFAGEGSAFTGTIDLSGLPFQPAGSYLTAEADTLQTVTSRGSSTNTDMSIGGTGDNRGLAIYYGAEAGGYGRIRFYQGTTNTNTIHSFSTSWQSGNVLVSGGALNLTGNTGVTIGGWNDPDAVFRTGGSTYFKNNVGIGVENATSKLQVSGNIDATGVISQTFWTNDSIRKLNSGASLNFRTAAGPIEMVLDGSGNLIVGGISANTSNGAKIFGLKSESGKYFTQNAFGQDGGYTWPSTTYVTGNDNSPVGNVTFRGNGAFQGHTGPEFVPIDATKTYKVSVWMRAVSGSPFCYLSHRQYFWDYSPGNPSNGGWGNPYWWSGTPSSSWTEYSMTIGPAGSGADYTHMVGVKFIQHGWLHNYTADGSATAEFQGWKIEELDSTLANNVTVLGNAYANSSFRAPIFYDSNDTTYYFDGNSTTSLRTKGSWRADSADWDGEYSGKIQYHSGHWYFQAGDRWYFRNAGGSNVFEVTQSGNVYPSGEVVSPTLKARKAQSDNNYTTAALWTESYSTTTTGLAFHISGVVGKFLEMRTNGTLYWDNNTVIHSANIASQSVSYATSSGNSVSTDQTNFSALTIEDAPVATKEYVTSQGYITGESDTLATVTGRGASTSSAITVNNRIEVSRNGSYGSYLDADLVVGTGASDRRGYGATGGSSIMLRSSSKSTITALDESDNLGQISYEGLVWTIGENIGWGVQRVDFPGVVNLSSTLRLPNDALVSVNNEPDTWGARFRTTTSTTNLGAQLKNIIWCGGGVNEGFAVTGSGTGGAAFEVANSGAAWAKDSFRAPTFRLTNSSNNAYITGNSEWGVTMANDNGYIQFGPANDGWSHIYSDKSFYFNQDLYVNGTRVVLNSGTWEINITGSAASATTATTATNLSGLGLIQSTSTGTSYQNNYQVRENSGGGGNTNEIYAPQLAFHWSGVVASSIMMESSGRIAIRNNPGGSYENFAAAVISATGGNSTNWNTAYGWGNHADAPYFNLETVDTVNVASSIVKFAGSVRVDGDLEVLGTITETSSIRFKENIVDLESSTEKVEQLRPVRYNKIGVEEEEIGLIAEEVAEIYPEVVTYNEEGEPTGVNYTRLSVILLKSVQELAERINKLENK